ncbi:bifunctional metallophosphatase/5'-nucleotidase [Gorillibacterium massiliense]|uniref:bifunctional metallophosphatase/5'-nucleotidase n=1 Tax=Gorillibacterium massiliense TaxID=1280390 RepID=UPI0004B7DD25|nr:5'-nucleotidase C-terminal domain-containing protein [Gorillibacterium massiliense]
MKRLRKSFTGLLVALMLTMQISNLVSAQDLTTAQENPEKRITILHVNDVHSRVEATAKSIGYAKISGIIKEVKKTNPNTLVLDAGDTLHGQTIANLQRGESIVDILNVIGLDAAATGNHDYNYGYKRLVELSKKANYPFLAANVYKDDGTRLFDPYIIKEMDGVKVAIFGLATPETLYKTHPKNVEGLTFTDPTEEAKKIVAELKDKSDVIIALTHLGLDQSSVDTSRKIAENVKGVDVIIDGHSHTMLEHGLVVGDTLIAQTGEYGENLGEVNIYLDKNNNITSKSAFLFSRSAADYYAWPDPAVDEIIAKVKASQDTVLSEVVGSTKVDLVGEREVVRVGESNLGHLITDAMLEESGADVALTNGGGIRASIPAGDITKGQVVTVLPFGNYIQTKSVTGADIKAALEHGVRSYPSSLGGFPHVAGVTFTLDASKPAGERVSDVKIKGNPLVPDKKYVLATNDFMAAGGDEYTMLMPQPVLNDYGSLDDVVIKYLQNHKEAASTYEPRMKIIGEKK